MTKAKTPALSKKAAERLLEAEQAVQRQKAELEEAEQAREKLRDEYRDRVPLSDDAAERKKGVRIVDVNGIKVRITPSNSGETFSLKRYREAGHKITKAMRDAIGAGKDFDRWTVKAPPESNSQ
jgi:hypothetical protein